MKYRIFFFLLKAVQSSVPVFANSSYWIAGFVSLSLWLQQIKLLASELEKTPLRVYVTTTSSVINNHEINY